MVCSYDSTVHSDVAGARDAASLPTNSTGSGTGKADKYTASVSSSTSTMETTNTSHSSPTAQRDMPPGSSTTSSTSSGSGILRNGTQPKKEQSYECDFDKNPTRLYMSLQERRWDEAVLRCETHLVEVATWISRREKNGRLRWRLLPLHAAVIFKAPERVIEALLCSNPRSAQEKDDQGMLPLHLAFRNGSNVGVVQLLLVAYPQSINVTDRKGRVPLVLAQASSSPNRDAFIQALQRGPAYYSVAAAASDRSASKVVEQRSTYESQIKEMERRHAQEVAELKDLERKKAQEIIQLKEQCSVESSRREEIDTAMASSATDAELKVQSLQDELDKVRDNSQVLVDHITMLENRMKGKDAKEKVMIDQIRKLEDDVQTLTAQTKEQDSFLVEERDTALSENSSLKESLERVKADLESAKEDILNQSVQATRAISSKDYDVKQMESYVDELLKELATAKESIAELQSHLQKKELTEQALNGQVTDLANRWVETKEVLQQSEVAHMQEILALKTERNELARTTDVLTEKLSAVASALSTMASEQDKIIETAAANDMVISRSVEIQRQLVEDTTEQAAKIERAKMEREEITNILARHAEDIDRQYDERRRILDAIMTQDESIRAAAKEREALFSRIQTQKSRMQMLAESECLGGENKINDPAAAGKPEVVTPMASASPMTPHIAASVPLPMSPNIRSQTGASNQNPIRSLDTKESESSKRFFSYSEVQSYAETRSRTGTLSKSLATVSPTQMRIGHSSAHQSTPNNKDADRERLTSTETVFNQQKPRHDDVATTIAQYPLTPPQSTDATRYSSGNVGNQSNRPVVSTTTPTEFRYLNDNIFSDEDPPMSPPTEKNNYNGHGATTQSSPEPLPMKASIQNPSPSPETTASCTPLTPATPPNKTAGCGDSQKSQSMPSPLSCTSLPDGRPPIYATKSKPFDHDSAIEEELPFSLSAPELVAPIRSLSTEELIEEGTNVLRKMPSLVGRDSPDGSLEGSDDGSDLCLRHATSLANNDNNGDADDDYDNEYGDLDDESMLEKEAKELEDQLAKLQSDNASLIGLYSVDTFGHNSLLASESYTK